MVHIRQLELELGNLFAQLSFCKILLYGVMSKVHSLFFSVKDDQILAACYDTVHVIGKTFRLQIKLTRLNR